ncbi:MAG: HU family DNA-binding protein [Acidobacteriota bacterium]|nr:HU family DNA-binding protein [Blastocatellia bacterium]MDW8413211.1 HU family DNA-binding protein [Acidobacteriota bacterium]
MAEKKTKKAKAAKAEPKEVPAPPVQEVPAPPAQPEQPKQEPEQVKKEQKQVKEVKSAKPAVKPMTKAEMVAKIAEKLGLKQRQVSDFFNELAMLAVEELNRAGQFQIHGIGKLVKGIRKARTAVNPKTKETVNIPERAVLRFRFAKACKEAIK